MSLHVIDLIKEQLGPALVSQASSQFGESESGISKAIGGLLPIIIGGLANNPNNPTVLEAIVTSRSSGILGNLLGGSSNNSMISNVLSTIFGNKINGLVNTIASYAGVNNNSASSLMNLVTGAAIGSVGKYATDNNLEASGISKLLGDQKGIVSSLLPAGLTLGDLNMGDWAKGYKFDHDTIKTSSQEQPIEITRSTTPTGTYPDRNNESGGSIWKWLLPLLLLIAAGYFLWKQWKKTETTTTIAATTDSTGKKTDSAVITHTNHDMDTSTAVKVDENIDLNGTSLKGYKGGMEDQMITFLKSNGYKNAKDDTMLKDKWYDFDHVNFKMGSSSELETGSQGQLDNLVAILKAYPDVKIKIGGYTDKTGDEATNVKISKARATFIKDWLSKAGVGGQVLDAEGYGSQFAKVDAKASDAERATDRKMSIRFSK
ncbi:DUF937 domain-containing protein [Chryseobacterium nematophagum]|uniref:DUF937 domain-containing protein n=1 Tax=Chryseobacterium nematophagum TaxID=2305228 RepID=A0A3M7TJI8_9FLAO|nr:OmpA family protein [Chryseobacterium nematophagum]RNA62819.1 DUF937 domain-containing protein [Chryseobacterium nematophagum]